MEKQFGPLSVIYLSGKQSMRLLPQGDVLRGEVLILLRQLLNNEQYSQCSFGSLLMKKSEGLLLDWGNRSIEIAVEAMTPLRLFLNMQELRKVVFFYKEEEYPFGCFSNCSAYGIEISGVWWPTAEHYFQAQKFCNLQVQAMIRSLASAHEAAKLGQDKSLPIRPDWEQIKEEIMRRAVLCKFKTHVALRQILLSTGNLEIVEDTSDDYYWGCGANGSGKNMLGKILMEVRGALTLPNASGSLEG